jgi:hypothetical protein
VFGQRKGIPQPSFLRVCPCLNGRRLAARSGERRLARNAQGLLCRSADLGDQAVKFERQQIFDGVVDGDTLSWKFSITDHRSPIQRRGKMPMPWNTS